MTNSEHPNGLIHQANCGRIPGEPISPKCGLDESVRYVSNEVDFLAASKAEALDWQHHAKAMQEQISTPTPSPTATPTQGRAVGQIFQDLPIAQQMVVLPSGSFWMGSAEDDADGYPNECPQHKVTIAYQLAMGRYPVTFEEWDACVADSGVSHKPKDKGWGRDKRPVINVSWDDAQAYAAWLNTKLGICQDDPYRYRLPSEAEWEYACRAGSQTQWCFGDDADALKEYSWYDKFSGDKTQPVGQKMPNTFGLYDMHGNVWEWVQDWYHDSYSDAPSDGSARVTGGEQRVRVQRGGAWSHDASENRSAYRYNDSPGNRGSYFGFRLARALPSPLHASYEA
jgi:formylglycine-generating enzyme required for sulfatase activity